LEHAVIDASRLPIVLCCAEESEVALVAVVDALHREGHAPEVVPGVETDANLVTTSADRVHGAALFVLCQSDDLDRFQVRRLEGLFSARKGPDHHMITVDVARRSAAAIVAEVRAAARDVSRGRTRSDDEDDGSYMRDVVLPTSVAAVPGATVDRGSASRGRTAPRSSVAQAPDGISDEALGLAPDTEVVDPRDLRRPAPPTPQAVLRTDPAARAALEEVGLDEDEAPSDGVPLAVPEDFPMVGESSPDVEIRAPKRGGWDRSGPVDVERVARPPRADPRAEADDTPLPLASSPIEVGRAAPVAPPPPEPPRRTARLVLLGLAAAGMGAVVTMAVLHATASVGMGDEGRAAPAKDDPAAGAQASDDVAEAGVPAASRDLGSARTASTGVGDPAGVVASDDATGSGGPASATTSAADSTGPATGDGSGTGDTDPGDAPTKPAPEGEPGAKVVPPPPTGEDLADSPAALLAAAIAEGRVRELEALLVLPTGPSAVTWDEAVLRCSRRKIGGLRNWRLPSKGQLAELRKAKILTTGSYWSRSTVGVDEVLVLDAASGRTITWLKMEPNGRVVCVRPRP
jgi:hypothetical protein